MSGYFSQLAHQTGLSFEPGSTKSASNFAPKPNLMVQAPESATPNPPHVEETSFTTASAPGTGEDTSERRATSPASGGVAAGTPDGRSPEEKVSRGDQALDGSRAQAMRSIEFPGEFREESRSAVADSASPTSSSRKLSAEEFPVRERPVPVPERPVFVPDEPMGAEGRIPPVESNRLPYDSIEIVERGSAARDPDAQRGQSPRPEAKEGARPEPIDDRVPAGAVSERVVERETIVRNYLKEIRAWVSAPPELDERELEGERDPDRATATRATERSLETSSDGFAPERQVQPTIPQPARSESLDQDLSLSIGTISIVIEEAKQVAPAAAPAPKSMDSSSAGAASEPTRLSRYYLERW